MGSGPHAECFSLQWSASSRARRKLKAETDESRRLMNGAVYSQRLNRRRRCSRAHTPRERAPRVGWGRAQGPEGGRAGGRKGGREGTIVLKAGGRAGGRMRKSDAPSVGRPCDRAPRVGAALHVEGTRPPARVVSRGGSFRAEGFFLGGTAGFRWSAAGCGVLAPVRIRRRRVGVADDAKPRELRQKRRFRRSAVSGRAVRQSVAY